MSIRHTLNERPKLALAMSAGLLALAVAMGVWMYPSGPETATARVFYSADDGQTYFAGPITQHPPFERDGQEVVRAFVFTCGEGGQPKVRYLMKYSPEGKARLLAADAKADGDYTDALDGMPPQHVLYKKPGGDRWLTGVDVQIKDLMASDCPKGQVVRAVLAGG
jgi:hypothetical protein